MVHSLHYFSCFYCRLPTFFKITFFKQLFQEGSTRVSNGLDPGLGPLKVATNKEKGRTNRQHCITTLGLETLHNIISEALLNGEVHPNHINTTGIRIINVPKGNINAYSKTCLERPLSKRPKMGFQDQSSLNAGQKYCRMLQGEHSAILSTCIKLTFAT